MKIHFYPVDPVPPSKRPLTLAEFADLHGLEMEIHEREPEFINPHCPRFYAHFRSTDVKKEGLLWSEFGNGNSQQSAMKDYARRIEGCKLIVNADDENHRREIRAPKAFRRSK